jgi:hypothetical protein
MGVLNELIGAVRAFASVADNSLILTLSFCQHDIGQIHQILRLGGSLD